MAGFNRDNTWSRHGFPTLVQRDGNDVSKVADNPSKYNGIVECGHVSFMDSNTGQPTEAPEYYDEDED